MRIILASTSPARTKLLEEAGIAHEIVAPKVDEDLEGEPLYVAQRLARAKAEAVAAANPDALVIGADQVLRLDGKAHGKPGDLAAARRQLTSLAGRAHELVTAVAVVHRSATRTDHDVARLEMRALEPAEVERYLATQEWEGCAGSYRIEGRGITLFSRIDGDFTTIRGLPMIQLCQILRSFGVALP
jgi:septum formation protein